MLPTHRIKRTRKVKSVSRKTFRFPRSFPVLFRGVSGPAVWELRHGMTSGRDVTFRNIKKSRLPSFAGLRRTFPLSFELLFGVGVHLKECFFFLTPNSLYTTRTGVRNFYDIWIWKLSSGLERCTQWRFFRRFVYFDNFKSVKYI